MARAGGRGRGLGAGGRGRGLGNLSQHQAWALRPPLCPGLSLRSPRGFQAHRRGVGRGAGPRSALPAPALPLLLPDLTPQGASHAQVWPQGLATAALKFCPAAT